MATTILLSMATVSMLFLVPADGNDRRELRDVMIALENRLESARDSARLSGESIDVRLRRSSGWTVLEIANVDSNEPAEQYRIEPSVEVGNRPRGVTRAIVTGTPRRFQFQALGQAGNTVSWNIRYGEARATLEIDPLSGRIDGTVL
ncbi:MAG: GspH/FimT family pseudopilin [Planctomycetota bacterium]